MIELLLVAKSPDAKFHEYSGREQVQQLTKYRNRGWYTTQQGNVFWLKLENARDG